MQAAQIIQPLPVAGGERAALSFQTVRELFHLRTLLETEAAARAASRPLDIGDLREAHARRAQGMHDYLDANTAFHVALARVGGNQVLADLLEDVMQRLQGPLQLVLRSPWPHQGASGHTHDDLLEAVLGGDREAARALVREHIAASRQAVLKALLFSSGPD